MVTLKVNVDCIDKDDIPCVKHDIEQVIEFYQNPKQKCLEIIENNKMINYSIICRILNYLQKDTDLVDEYLCLSKLDGEIDNCVRIFEYMQKDECLDENYRIEFLQGLLKSKIDLTKNLYYVYDGVNFMFMNDNKIIDLIKYWLNDIDFVLENEIARGIYDCLNGED